MNGGDGSNDRKGRNGGLTPGPSPSQPRLGRGGNGGDESDEGDGSNDRNGGLTPGPSPSQHRLGRGGNGGDESDQSDESNDSQRQTAGSPTFAKASAFAKATADETAGKQQRQLTANDEQRRARKPDLRDDKR